MIDNVRQGSTIGAGRRSTPSERSVDAHFLEQHERETERYEQAPWLNKRGGGDTYLYFIQALDPVGGPIKIGTAKDPMKRLRQLQTGHPYRLALGHFAWITSSFERRIHALFKAYRLEGEWFKAHPVIAEMGACEPDPELVGEPFEYPADAALRIPDDLGDRGFKCISGSVVAKADWAANPNQGYVAPATDTITWRPVPEGIGWRYSNVRD